MLTLLVFFISVSKPPQPQGSTNLEWVEYVWNDPLQDPSYPWGTGGGGVSDFFPLPSYQAGVGVPVSVNTTYTLTLGPLQ